MDILDNASGINLSDSDWKIYARNTAEPPHFVGTGARIANSVVSEGCVVEGEVVNSIVSRGVKIEKGAKIYDSIVMPNVVVKKNASINHSIVGWDAVIGENATVGAYQEKAIAGEWQIAVVGPNVNVLSGSVVAQGAMVEEDN